jgi:hypothetical protein
MRHADVVFVVRAEVTKRFMAWRTKARPEEDMRDFLAESAGLQKAELDDLLHAAAAKNFSVGMGWPDASLPHRSCS